MKSSMTSTRVIYVHREREKVDFKSREVNCLNECALALRGRPSPSRGSLVENLNRSPFL